MTKNCVGIVLLLLGLLFLAGPPARMQEEPAGVLYALRLNPTTSSSDAWKIAELVKVNAVTGKGTKIGTVGAGLDQRQWSADLSFAPDGTLWCVNGTKRAENLVTIDITTGTGTIVGSTDSLIEGIAFDAEGVLYAADSGSNNWDNTGDKLVIVDTETFIYTVVGYTSYDIDGLAFAPDGTLYGVDSGIVLRIDEKTGKATKIGETATGVYSITFAPDGTMYAATGSALYWVDPETAATYEIGSTGFTYIVGLEHYRFPLAPKLHPDSESMATPSPTPSLIRFPPLPSPTRKPFTPLQNLYAILIALAVTICVVLILEMKRPKRDT